ncbi:serine/threonine protein kinase [Nocardiopsis ansamitocini]|uniref:Protein kinase domain-containing protein n=1 Tax=Nocardiopsis ansamitocini TaxID=1670832 RepID=A0A9W6P7W0_9ACTN|nr:serine/threonine protein kinase [Nocardiopsis ansamitocini]GLU48795.1 hypothetical protein Nans01_31460 [Nocardiopsis ansamitocini]
MGPLENGDPERIGRYRLIGRLGAGGMGQVFFGRSAGGRAVAIKRIHPHLATDESFRQRFGREVTAARQVSGAFTAPVIDADPEGEVPWLVTSYVPSLPLDEAVQAHGPLPEASLRVLAASLAEALNEIHRVGLIHRDLKPANVLLAEDGPRVIDFGIARATEGTAATQSIIGTPGFMSPEQIQGAHLTPKSDVFAYGAVLAYAAGGIGPFGEGAMPTMVMRILQNEPDLSKVPPALQRLVAACLSKDERYRPGPGDVLDALGDVPAGTSWLPPQFMHGVQEQVAKVNAALSGAPLTPGADGATVALGSGPQAATEMLGNHQATRVAGQPGTYGGDQGATSVMGMGAGPTGAPAAPTAAYGQQTGYGPTGGQVPPTAAYGQQTGGQTPPTAALPATGRGADTGYGTRGAQESPSDDEAFSDLYRGSRRAGQGRGYEEQDRAEQRRQQEQRRRQDEERMRYEQQQQQEEQERRRRDRERRQEQRREQEAERAHRERMRSERRSADQPDLWGFVKLIPLLIIPLIQIPLGWAGSLAWEWFATTDVYTGSGWWYAGIMTWDGFFQALCLGYFLLNNVIGLEYLVRSLRTSFVTGIMLALAVIVGTNCGLWYFGWF